MSLDFESPHLEPVAPSLHMPAITLYGDYFCEDAPQELYYGPQALHRSRSDLPPWNPTTVRNQPMFIPRSPSAWNPATDDPFQSPAQLNQMFAFCKSCSCATTNLTLCEVCTNVLYDRRTLAPTWY